MHDFINGAVAGTCPYKNVRSESCPYKHTAFLNMGKPKKSDYLTLVASKLDKNILGVQHTNVNGVFFFLNTLNIYVLDFLY